MDPVPLARLQFALTVGFHFIFPSITLGFAWLLVIVEGIGWRTRDEDWIRAGKYFGGIFALTFAVGVATGIVMEFQDRQSSSGPAFRGGCREPAARNTSQQDRRIHRHLPRAPEPILPGRGTAQPDHVPDSRRFIYGGKERRKPA